MNGVTPWGKAMVLGAIVAMVLTLHGCPKRDISKEGTSNANQILSRIELPSLPDGVTEARSWAGGTFAKFVNVKFTASREQALAYLTAGEAAYYLELSTTDGKLAVAATHLLGTPRGTPDSVVPTSLELGTGIAAEPWFESVYQIRNGWFYEFREGITAYQFYYDLDTGQFYIYWSYS
jgi:hypothetical protein